MDDIELQRLINYLVDKYDTKINSRMRINQKSDLIQEAMIVVPIAMKTWDKNKKAALKTYVQVCVANRLKNILRVENSQKLYDNDNLSELPCPDDPIEAFEFDLTMKKILLPIEFSVYRLYYVYGCTTREIRSKLQINSTKVQLCLRSISQKYQSLEASLKQISTQRRLTRDFLSITEMS